MISMYAENTMENPPGHVLWVSHTAHQQSQFADVCVQSMGLLPLESAH